MSRATSAWEIGDEAVPDGLWYGRYNRAMNGPTGLKRLEETRDALRALPEPKLIADKMADGGQVCFVGALAAKRLAERSGLSWPEAVKELAERTGRAAEDYYGDEEQTLFDTSEVAQGLDIPWTVAWEWGVLNDSTWANLTPEERFIEALKWVERKIAEHPTRQSP
jgi:hypothetical protein